MDTNKSQADGSLYKELEKEETENVLEEQDKIQNEKQNQNIDIIPNVQYRIKVVQNGNDIELTEKNNSTDTNKSNADGSLYKEVEETENVLEEQDETQNEKQNQNIDIISNVTESRMEYEIATHINIKEKEQPEDIDKRDKKIEKSPKIIDEVQQKISQDEWEELDDDILSVSLFDEKEKSKD